MKLSGGCHCGAVRFAIAVEPPLELLDCNCSICTMTGFLHLIVPHSRFDLEAGEGAMTSYRFATRQADHLFCGTCGVKSFYQPRSHPQCWSVNFRCLEGTDGLETRIHPFDGRDWENARDRLKD